MNMPYAVATLRFNLQTFVLLSPEDHGPALFVDAETWQVVRTLDTPGGTMDMVQHFPDGPIYAVMNCFLGYKFQDAAIYTLQPHDIRRPSDLWHIARVVDLPFAHRLQPLSIQGREYLIAATLAEQKTSPQDWSTPGSVRLYDTSHWQEPTLLLSNLHRNHGLARISGGFEHSANSQDEIWVSAMEGLFASTIEASHSWNFTRLTERDISEYAYFDIDGDGARELITIEPFHGPALRVYRVEKTTEQETPRYSLTQVAEHALEYGHGLWAGKLMGTERIIVGNRAGHGNLLMFTPANRSQSGNNSIELHPTILAKGVKTAHVAVLPRTSNSATLIAANQGDSSFTKYELSF